MKLFYKVDACSLSAHIVLYETGLDFTAEKVDLVQKKTNSGADYLNINPKGQVPALLLDDSSLLTEGVAIIQYLADCVPDRDLMPVTGTLTRYHAIEWLNYIATELHKGFSPLFNPKTPDEYRAIAKANLEQQFNYLNSVLAKQHYLLGNQFSVADTYLFIVLRWAMTFHFNTKHYTHLIAWFDRIAARPGVIAALNAEGLK